MNTRPQQLTRRGTVVRRLAGRALLTLALAVCDAQTLGLPEHTGTAAPASPGAASPAPSGRPTLRLLQGGAR